MSSSNPPRPILTYAEATEIVELLRSSSAFSEFRLRSGDLEIEVRRGGTSPAAAVAPAAPAAAPAAPPTPAAQPLPAAAAPAPAPTSPTAAPRQAAAGAHSDRAVLIKSPMVGTFYRAPEPGAAPFVQPGQSVQADTTVCIIEVMKLMNTLQAGAEGVVKEILIGDGEAVEFGQLLIVIEPH